LLKKVIGCLGSSALKNNFVIDQIHPNGARELKMVVWGFYFFWKKS